MAIKTEDMMVMIFSIVIGAIIGEVLKLDQRFSNLAQKVKERTKSKNDQFTNGLISSTMLFCIGSLAILGPLEEGLSEDASLLYVKSIIDGFTAIVLASMYGTGVLFSVIPLFLYQGSITLLAGRLEPYLSDSMMNQLSATGGIMIIGLALNVLAIKEVKVANFLPALVVAVILTLVLG